LHHPGFSCHGNNPTKYLLNPYYLHIFLLKN
jgi:hypothetical protein